MTLAAASAIFATLLLLAARPLATQAQGIETEFEFIGFLTANATFECFEESLCLLGCIQSFTITFASNTTFPLVPFNETMIPDSVMTTMELNDPPTSDIMGCNCTRRLGEITIPSELTYDVEGDNFYAYIYDPNSADISVSFEYNYNDTFNGFFFNPFSGISFYAEDDGCAAYYDQTSGPQTAVQVYPSTSSATTASATFSVAAAAIIAALATFVL